MEQKKSELEQLISDIKKNTNSIAINKVDEILVMRAMLNDPEFYVGVYDRNNGYIGQSCPHANATNFLKNVIMNTTGLDSHDSRTLAEHYEFTKKDASFFVGNMKDFLNVYTSTGRKINVIQNANTEASLYLKDVPGNTKVVPDNSSETGTKVITTVPYTKLVSVTKCPRYKKE